MVNLRASLTGKASRAALEVLLGALEKVLVDYLTEERDLVTSTRRFQQRVVSVTQRRLEKAVKEGFADSLRKTVREFISAPEALEARLRQQQALLGQARPYQLLAKRQGMKLKPTTLRVNAWLQRRLAIRNKRTRKTARIQYMSYRQYRWGYSDRRSGVQRRYGVESGTLGRRLGVARGLRIDLQELTLEPRVGWSEASVHLTRSYQAQYNPGADLRTAVREDLGKVFKPPRAPAKSDALEAHLHLRYRSELPVRDLAVSYAGVFARRGVDPIASSGLARLALMEALLRVQKP